MKFYKSPEIGSGPITTASCSPSEDQHTTNVENKHFL